MGIHSTMGCKPSKSKARSQDTGNCKPHALRQSDRCLAQKHPKSGIRHAATCAICACEMSSDVEHLPCAHSFHTACIEEWRRRGRNDCPICRHPMRATADQAAASPDELEELDDAHSIISPELLEAAKPKCLHCAGSGTLPSGNIFHICSWCRGSGEESDEIGIQSSGNRRDDDSGHGLLQSVWGSAATGQQWEPGGGGRR